MNPRLLEYYNQELQHIRESAAEFAEEFPKIAGRLSLSGFECADPYVERLLEGFAYLTARVQLKLDAEYPTFTHNLLEIAYPHYLAPTPSMTVVQLRPDPNEGALSSGFSVAWAPTSGTASTSSACAWGRWTSINTSASCPTATTSSSWPPGSPNTWARSWTGTSTWSCNATKYPRSACRAAGGSVSTPGWAIPARTPGIYCWPASTPLRGRTSTRRRNMSEISRVALFGKLNSLAYKAIEAATVFCKLRGNPYVELVHWFHQILQLPDSDLHQIVRQSGIDPARLAKDLTEALDRLPRGSTSITDLSSHVEEAKASSKAPASNC
ncbi:hypothetical protein Z046_31020 [Pseudomonas aeruginosa VRFPA09]|nr:hypothetical protein Z046_31020 [Pseudomonas aeruginosa VRFPA09]